MRKVHFFKAKCRFGLPNIPHRQKKLNIGVENGPDSILTKKFLSSLRSRTESREKQSLVFGDYKISELLFSKPEDIKTENFNDVLAKNYLSFKNLIIDSLLNNETPVVIGGDDSVTFSSLLSTIDRFGTNFGYIRIDSHIDMHLYQSSITKNFHGMYHRALFDSFDIPQISNLVNQKLMPQNSIFIGNLDKDYGEKDFFEIMKFKNINSRDFSENQINVNKYVKGFVNSFEHIHLSFDIDALNKKIAPATGIPAEKGLLIEDVMPILEIVSKHYSISFDLVEVNPKKRGAQKTIKLAQKILKELL